MRPNKIHTINSVKVLVASVLLMTGKRLESWCSVSRRIASHGSLIVLTTSKEAKNVNPKGQNIDEITMISII